MWRLRSSSTQHISKQTSTSTFTSTSTSTPYWLGAAWFERGNQGMAVNRTITLVVALATLASNVMSSLLFHQLPDDPYHLASKFGGYLYFANVLSVFGFIGALREHAISMAIFANYLILDTILCSAPRFLILGLLNTLMPSLCWPSSTPSSLSQQYPALDSLYTPPLSSNDPGLPYPTSQWDSVSGNWSVESCEKIFSLAQWTLVAGVIAGTLLQFAGALCVREYAKALWIRDLRQEADVLADDRATMEFAEEGGFKAEKY